MGANGMTSKKFSGRMWTFVVCAAMLTLCVVLVVRRCGFTRHTGAHLEAQRALLAAGGFHSDGSGTAIDQYAAALRLLQQHGWTRQRLREYTDENAALPVGDSLKVLEDVASLVIRGATMRDAGMPRISMLRTKATVGSGPIDLVDLGLTSDAALIVVRSRLQSKDYGGAIRLSRAVFALGLHLMTADHDVLSAIGIVHRQKAIRILRSIALDNGESESVKAYDAILAALDDELDAHKRRSHKREPGLLDVIDFMRDKETSGSGAPG
jgi:hypothetical protein